MDDKQFQIIVSKLDAIIKLQAMAAVQGRALKEQVATLSAFNFQPKQIADLLGKTPNHISVILSELRRAERKTSDQLGEQSGRLNKGREESK
ncbi:MAG: hypothetical protein ABSD81_02830 [Methanomicrobiales archaeon]|jgi:hypothetical protein